MARSALLKHLGGPDRRSIGGSDRVVKLVSSNPALFQELLLEMWSPDLLVRMRAADAVEKVTRRHRDLLQPYQRKLLALAEKTSQQEIQWHLAQMLPRLELTVRQRRRAAAVLESYLDSESSIVKTCALQALCELSVDSPGLRSRTEELLGEALRAGTPAMRARARKLLAKSRT